MRSIRIFISSPGDVTEERDKAEAVIRSLDAYYAGRAHLVPVRWENLGLSADASFQEGVLKVLTAEGGVDIAVFIMWSRLGTPLGAFALRPDGQPYRSGTAQEFDLMLTARRESDGARPHLLAYVRSDDKAYSAVLGAAPVEQHTRIVAQRTAAEDFIRETFTDAATGQNLRAFHTYDRPVTFADRLRVHLRDVLDQLVGVEAGAARWDEAPYRGLEVFDVDHEPIFRGREEQVCEILQRLRQCAEAGCAFVVIVGASGSGKSSLARAGVAAHLLHFNLDDAVCRWRCAVFTPGMADGALFAGLARALAAAGALPEVCSQVDDLGDLAGELEKNSEATVKLVLRPAFRAADAAAGGAVRLLLVLDQFEELHTDRRISSEDREKFLAALGLLARSGSIHILATLRSDFYGAAQRDETFLRLKGEQGHYDLLPPSAAALRLIITEPARLAGLHFERDEATGHTLDARLLEDALRQPDALPLLQYSLRELYEQRSPEGLLTFGAYEAIGGVEGAIGRRAEAVFTSLPEAVKAAFDDALWSLITVDPDNESTPVRRRAPQPPPDDDSPRAALLTALVRERFLTADRTGNQATVSLAHEALLRSWPRVVEWLRENRDLLRIRRRVEEGAGLWREKGEHRDYLLAPGLPLIEAESLLARRSSHFELDDGQLTLDFVQASGRVVRRAQRRRSRMRAALTGTFAVLMVLALAAAVVAFRKKRDADVASTGLLAQKQIAEKANVGLRDQLRLMSRYDQAVAQVHFLNNDWASAIAYLARAIKNDPENRSAGAQLWSELVHGTANLDPIPRHLLRHEKMVMNASFSPDGTRVVTASFDGTARVWEAASGQPVGVALRHEKEVWSASFSPDGMRVVTASSDGTARVWEAASAQPVGVALRHEKEVKSASFSPDGMRVVTASSDGTARVWETASGQPVGVALRHEKEVWSASFSPDGTRVVTASLDGTARVWEEASGQPVGVPLRHEKTVMNASFSPDGTRVVTVSSDGTARVWETASGQPVGVALRHEKEVWRASFSPDGTRVVTASQDGTARVWEAASGQPVGVPLRHEKEVFSASFSPDGMRVVTASFDGTARVWEAASGQPVGVPLRHANWVFSASFSPDGMRVVTASSDGIARVWEAATGQPVGVPLRHEKEVRSASFSPDGMRVVTASRDGTARVWEAATGQPMGVPLRHDEATASFSPDGRRVVTASLDGTARVWEAATGQPVGVPLRHENWVWSASFSPEGTRVVTASLDGTARVWEAASGQPVGAPLRHEKRVWSASFSPDGTRVVTASDDGTARVWEAANGQPVGVPLRHEQAVRSASFSPDGMRVVTASDDGTARVWEAASGQPVGVPLRHEQAVRSASFSPDGMRVVTASGDGTARVWEAASGKPGGVALRHEKAVWSASFSPDGTRVVTASFDGTTRVWEAATGQPMGVASRHEREVRSASFSPDGTRVVTASDDGTARVWGAASGLPGGARHLDALIGAVAGRKFSEGGELEVVSGLERAALRDHLAVESIGDSAADKMVRWLIAPPEERTVNPAVTVSLRELADREIASGNEAAIQQARSYDPGNPLIQIALASFESDERRAGFLRDHGLGRLPADPALWSRAAEMLLAQKQESAASRAIARLQELDAPASARLQAGVEALHDFLKIVEAPTTPKKFRFLFQLHDPGYREWTRKADQWVEKLPTGITKVFTILKREEMEGRRGTVATLNGDSEFRVFISDRDVSDPCIYVQSGKGKWDRLGNMENIE